jgi:DNA-binding transcriptional regulator YhcF (GntR family)
MASATAPRIVEVAQWIAADIRRRKLRPGDAYPSTAETAGRLHISGSTVNRAFQLLAQRGVVQRRRRQGTIVADPGVRSARSALARVHLLVREDHLQAEGLWADGVLLGLQGSLPGVELRFNFRPQEDEAEYVRQLIHDALAAREAAGMVLIRSTVVSQRLVAASGLPAVVSGTLQPSIHDLPSIDRDQRQIGVLLARHLLDERCRSFLILMRDRITAGDHAMLDGALSILSEAGIALDRVQLRCLPSDERAIAAEAGQWLERARSRVGCLCRSEPLARGVDQAAKDLKLGARRRPAIVVADVARRVSSDAPYPCIETTLEPEAWGAELGRMLAMAASGKRPDPYRRVIPVKLSQ